MTSPGPELRAAEGAPVIRAAEGDDDMETVRELFLEYQEAIGVDLCFQGFEEEVAALPGRYGRPLGCLLLAMDGDKAAGVIGMGPLGDGPGKPTISEMKRLYVRPPWRGTGLGRELSVAVIEAARRAGHKTLCLDTLEFMAEAQKLYRSLGFVEIPAYYDNPRDGVLYMELALE